MKFVWDELKNRANIHRHGIDFKDVVELFDHPMLLAIDNRKDYGEERWVGIGFIKSLVAVVVYTENGEKEITRLISARKATKNESQRFKKAIGY